MAGKRISQLPIITALEGDELLPIVKNGVTSRVEASVLAAAMSNGGVTPFDYYVDSVNGSDSNDGLTAETAFQTLSAAQSVLSPGDRIGLARGSFFRGTLEGVSVLAYGTGKMPVIDCSDVAENASFSKTDGQSNVYEISWADHEFAAQDKTKIRGWENGVPLVRAASIEDCDSTPGSYYCNDGLAATDPVLFYLHPSGSDNPVSNGKTYEITRRKYAIVNTPLVVGVRTRRNGHHDGSVVTTDGAILRNCIFEDGNVHNAMVRGNGLVDRCIFYKGEAYLGAGSSTLLVTYAVPASGKVVTIRRSIFIGNNDNTKGQVAHTSHGADSNDRFESIIFEDCAFYGVQGCGGGTTKNLVSRRNYYRDVGSVHLATESVLYEDLWVDCGHAPADGGYNLARIAFFSAKTATITGLRATARQASGALLWIGGAVDLRVDNSVIAFRNKISWPHKFVRLDTAGSSLSLNKTIFTDGSAVLELNAAITYSGDHNVFYPGTMDVKDDATSYTDVAPWIAATGQDANSVIGDPQLVDPLNGDFSLSPGSPAAGLGIALAPVDYTAIPSDEEIEAM